MAELANVDWQWVLPLLVIQVTLQVAALLDWYKASPYEVNGKKIVWLFVILFINTIGPILYFMFGKKR